MTELVVVGGVELHFQLVVHILGLCDSLRDFTDETFFLGVVAAFVSLLASRLSAVVERVRTLNAITDDDHARGHLKGDLERLKLRARYLNSAIVATLYSGLCATLLLAILFVSALFRLKHAYGAALLFVLATFFLGFALFRFAQEARIGLAVSDEYQ